MRSALIGLLTLSFSAFAIAVSACAEAPPVDDLDGVEQEEQATEPEPEKVALPPSNPPAEEPKDAGTSPPKEEDKKDPPPPPPPPPPPTNEDCDPADMSYYLKWVMASASGTIDSCPCSAGQCCYMALGCVDK